EETEERWDPNAVVRSRQTTTETSAAAIGMAGGVAGARANQPQALSTSTAAAPAGPIAEAASGGSAEAGASRNAPVPGRSTETTNCAIGRVTRHTVSPQGQLARLSVAVILDDERVMTRAANGTTETTTKPWEPARLDGIRGIVSAAVGLDA